MNANGSLVPGGREESFVRANVDALLARWWIIAAVTLAGAVAALVWSATLPAVYQSTATVVLDQSASSLTLAPGMTGQPSALLDTMAEIVRSRAVLDRAVDSLRLPRDQRKAALQTMAFGLRVTRGRTTQLLKIQTEGPTSEIAATYTNAIADAFLAWHVESRRESASAGRAFIAAQLEEVGRVLRAAEDARSRYKVASGQIELSEHAKTVIEQLASFEAQLRTAVADRRAVETSIGRTRAQIGLQAPMITTGITRTEDPVYVQLRAQLAELEGQLALLREQFTEDHPRVRAVMAQIEDVKRRMGARAALVVLPAAQTLNPIRQSLVSNLITLEVQREAMRAREAALARALQRYERDVQALPPKEAELARLARDVQVAEATYLLLSQRLEDARIAEASIVGDLRIVDRAVPTTTPISPRPRMNTLLGGLGGLVVGLAAAYVLEALDTTFKTPEEAATALGLPLLATIPLSRARRGVRDKSELPLVEGDQRRSPFAESFRHLRTGLLYLDPDRPLRSVLVTSAGPGEGKSTVSANLAISFTQTGQSVWLLECDMRKPSLIWTFQPKMPLGLSDLLVDGLPLSQALNPTSVDRLWFITGGTTPPNPAELLGSQKMRSFVDEHSQDSNLLVLDAPPILPVTDAVVLSRLVDGVVFVLHLTKTPREAARRAHEHLASMGARVVGLVVNGVPTGRRGGYYYYYSRYYGADVASQEPEKDTSGKPSEQGARPADGRRRTPRA